MRHQMGVSAIMVVVYTLNIAMLRHVISGVILQMHCGCCQHG